jgi:HlyD family secretion protein
MKSSRLLPALLILFLIACDTKDELADAYGNFEAIEVMVSAESQGKIMAFEPEEGAALAKDQVTVVIDTAQLYLQKIQLESAQSALLTRIQTLDAQIRASQVQMNNLERERKRIDKLAEGGAATAKQQDDIQGQIALLEAQIQATGSQKSSVYAERRTLEVQIQQVDDRIAKCAVRNPVAGILLTKYKEAGEVTAPGQPLYKVANLDELILRAYVSGMQLSSVAIGQEVRVRFDGPRGRGGDGRSGDLDFPPGRVHAQDHSDP